MTWPPRSEARLASKLVKEYNKRKIDPIETYKGQPPLEFHGWSYIGRVTKYTWVMKYAHVSGVAFAIIVPPATNTKEVAKLNRLIRRSIKIIEEVYGESAVVGSKGTSSRSI